MVATSKIKKQNQKHGIKEVSSLLPSFQNSVVPQFWQQPHLHEHSSGRRASSAELHLWDCLSFPWSSRDAVGKLLALTRSFTILYSIHQPYPHLLSNWKCSHLSNLTWILFTARTLIDTSRDCITQVPGIETRTKESLSKYLLNECALRTPASLCSKLQKNTGWSVSRLIFHCLPSVHHILSPTAHPLAKRHVTQRLCGQPWIGSAYPSTQSLTSTYTFILVYYKYRTRAT